MLFDHFLMILLQSVPNFNLKIFLIPSGKMLNKLEKYLKKKMNKNLFPQLCRRDN